MISFLSFLTESEAKIQMILTKQGEKVWQSYTNDNQNVFKFSTGEEVIRELDSWNEKYLQWLVNQYVNDNFSLSDKIRVDTIVDIFDKHRVKFKYSDKIIDLGREIVVYRNREKKNQEKVFELIKLLSKDDAKKYLDTLENFSTIERSTWSSMVRYYESL